MKTDYLSKIRRYWDDNSVEYCQSHPEHMIRDMHPSWGLSHIPETQLGLLRGISNRDGFLVDLGCGQGHDAVGFAELGYRVLGVDLSEMQIAQAVKHDRVEYFIGAAEHLPLDSASACVVVSDHGAFDHSPSGPLLREVHRVLKPAGTLIICTYSPIAMSCFDRSKGRIGPRLVGGYPSGAARYDGTIVTVERSHADWIREFRGAGFKVDRLEEPLLSEECDTYFDELVDSEWARRWPLDLIWVVRKE